MRYSGLIRFFVLGAWACTPGGNPRPQALESATVSGQVTGVDDQKLMSAELDLLPAADTTSYYSPGEAARSGFVALADSAGNYVFQKVPPGRYRMVVRMLGYRAIRERLHVEPGASIRRDFRMTPTPPME
jgi:hypothetical protein